MIKREKYVSVVCRWGSRFEGRNRTRVPFDGALLSQMPLVRRGLRCTLRCSRSIRVINWLALTTTQTASVITKNCVKTCWRFLKTLTICESEWNEERKKNSRRKLRGKKNYMYLPFDAIDKKRKNNIRSLVHQFLCSKTDAEVINST